MPPSRIYKGTTLVYERPTASPLTAFLTGLQNGDRIQLFRAANIRTDAVISTTTLKGVNLSGTRGTIVGGPKTGISNSIWYNINFDTGHDGWCVSDNYTKISSTTVQTTPSYFKVGDKVKLYRAANSRSSAAIANNLLGVIPKDATGTITVGPTLTAGINWYKIDFDTASHKDGYVASDNYVKVATSGGGGGDDWVTGSCAPAVPSNGKIINVASGGNISNAIKSAKPGDTVVVANGTYNQTVNMQAANSGTANAWITIKSATPYGAKIAGRFILFKCDYVRIEGFEFNGTQTKESGTSVQASHHTQILNNRINIGKIFNGGCDFLLVEGNVVHGNILGYNQIEVLYPQNHTGDTSTKNRIIVRNNVSYDNNRPDRTDGSGFMIDCFSLERPGDRERKYFQNLLRRPAAPYTHGAIIDNNIAYDNTGAGIYINYSDNLTITNNICYNNRLSTNPNRASGNTWSGEISVVSSKNNLIQNNILVTAGKVQTYGIACQGFSDRTSSGNTWTGNITYDKSKPGNASIAVMSTCPVPTATNKLGQGSSYAKTPTDFLKKPCS